MKTLIIILLGIAAGWFIRSAVDTYIERINDWRQPAWWAVIAIAEIIAVLICARIGIPPFA